MNTKLTYQLCDENIFDRVLNEEWRDAMGRGLCFFVMLVTGAMLIGLGFSVLNMPYTTTLVVALMMALVGLWIRAIVLVPACGVVLFQILVFPAMCINLERAEPEFWPRHEEGRAKRFNQSKQKLVREAEALAEAFQLPWWVMMQWSARDYILAYCASEDVKNWEASVRIYKASLKVWQENVKHMA